MRTRCGSQLADVWWHGERRYAWLLDRRLRRPLGDGWHPVGWGAPGHVVAPLEPAARGADATVDRASRLGSISCGLRVCRSWSDGPALVNTDSIGSVENARESALVYDVRKPKRPWSPPRDTHAQGVEDWALRLHQQRWRVSQNMVGQLGQVLDRMDRQAEARYRDLKDRLDDEEAPAC